MSFSVSVRERDVLKLVLEMLDAWGWGRREVAADEVSLDGGVAGSSRLGAVHLGKEDAELGIEKADVAPAEDLCNEGAAGIKNAGADSEGGEHELGLDVLIKVV